MHTTLFLIRCGETEWGRARRLQGRRDLGLSSEGRAQAQSASDLLAGVDLTEILSSPLLRAVETAEIIAAPHRLNVAHDPRLTELRVGRWEGKSYADLAVDPDYRAFLRDPVGHPIPDGEPLTDLKTRAASSVDQALEDNQIGAHVAMVTHASVVRVLLAHFLGMTLASYHQLHVGAGAITVLRFDSDRAPPRVLAVNQGETLAGLLAGKK